VGRSLRTWRSWVTPYLFLLPFLVLFLLFFVFPFFYSGYLSLFVSRAGNNVYVGLHNYLQVMQDSSFWGSMGTILKYGIFHVTLGVIISIGLALLIDTPYVKGKNYFRLFFFLPYAVPGVIAAVMWGFLYSPQLDPVAHLLRVFNHGHDVNLLATHNLLYGIVNMATWLWAGYWMTIYVAALTSVPPELYEAAKMDGCSEFRMAWNIKLPLLRPTIIMNCMLAIIGAMQLFNEPFVLSSLTTVSDSYTPNMDIYHMAFTYNNFNYSATIAVVLAVITIAASLVFMYFTTRDDRSVRFKDEDLHGEVGL